MLEVKNLIKKYPKTTAVNDMNFTIRDGEIGVLLGPNGAGKSTIIKSAAGLLTHEGEVKVNGKDTGTLEAKKEFAYIPELPSLYDDLTVREHLDFIAKAYKLPDTYKQDAEELLEAFEMTDKADRLGTELSKGMMQKTSICMALITKPSCILVDEPMVGLDPKAIRKLKSILCELRDEGASILISTHMLEMIDDIWDVMVVIKEGKVLGTFRKEDLKDETISRFFFEVTEQGEGGE